MSGKKNEIDWEVIENEYMTGKMSIRELADSHGLNYNSLRKRAGRCKWVDKRKRLNQLQTQNRLSHVTEKLLIKISETIDREDGMDAKDYKALSSALKELGEIQEHLEMGDRQETEKTIVQMSSELEEMSK